VSDPRERQLRAISQGIIAAFAGLVTFLIAMGVGVNVWLSVAGGLVALMAMLIACIKVDEGRP
jgi:hypothetical protein